MFSFVLVILYQASDAFPLLPWIDTEGIRKECSEVRLRDPFYNLGSESELQESVASTSKCENQALNKKTDVKWVSQVPELLSWRPRLNIPTLSIVPVRYNQDNDFHFYLTNLFNIIDYIDRRRNYIIGFIDLIVLSGSSFLNKFQEFITYVNHHDYYHAIRIYSHLPIIQSYVNRYYDLFLYESQFSREVYGETFLRDVAIPRINYEPHIIVDDQTRTYHRTILDLGAYCHVFVRLPSELTENGLSGIRLFLTVCKSHICRSNEVTLLFPTFERVDVSQLKSIVVIDFQHPIIVSRVVIKFDDDFECFDKVWTVLR